MKSKIMTVWWKLPEETREIFRSACREYKVPLSLAAALAWKESDFDSSRISEDGAKGMFQLMPVTCAEVGVNNPHDPKEGIPGGIRYLRKMYNRFSKDWTLALAAYNAGPGNVRKYHGVPPFPETKTYIKRIQDYQEIFKAAKGY